MVTFSASASPTGHSGVVANSIMRMPRRRRFGSASACAEAAKCAVVCALALRVAMLAAGGEAHEPRGVPLLRVLRVKHARVLRHIQRADQQLARDADAVQQQVLRAAGVNFRVDARRVVVGHCC